MCVEGLRAIPLGCSDCYDKDNILGAGGWQAGWSRLWCLGRGRAGASALPGKGQAGSPHRTLLSIGLRNGSLPWNNCSLNT